MQTLIVQVGGFISSVFLFPNLVPSPQMNFSSAHTITVWVVPLSRPTASLRVEVTFPASRIRHELLQRIETHNSGK